MAVSFWVASINVCVCFGVPLRECQSLNYSNEQTLNFLLLVQVYGDNAMKKTAVYKWMKRFSEGRESVTDEER